MGQPTGGRIVEVVGSLKLGGAERVALEVAAGLAQRHAQFETEMLCAGPDVNLTGDDFERSIEAESQRRGVPVRRIPFAGLTDAAGRQAILSYLRSGQVSLVHIHNRPQDWQIVPLCRLAGIPVTFTVHLPYELTNWRQRLLRLTTARAVPLVICVSEAVADHIAVSEHVPASRLRVIHNGIRTDIYKPLTAAQRAAKRAELGWRDADFIWLCAARLSHQKGHEFLLEAAALLPPTSAARLVLAGDGDLRATLEAQSSRLGLGSRVTFLGTRQDVPALLGAADGYACSSRQEGHPLALLEAMNSELPVIGPRLPSILEIAFPAGSPVLYGPSHSGWAHKHDPKDIVEALLDVERRSTHFRHIAVTVRQQVTTKFSREAMIDAHAEVYARMTGRG